MLLPVPASAAPTSRDVGFARWEGAPAFRTGAFAGLRLKHGTLVLKDATKTRTYHGRTYSMGTWTSAATSPGFAFTQLVASWSAVTPKNSWVEVRVKAGGHWMVLGRWASSDKHVRRTSVPGESAAKHVGRRGAPGQADPAGRVDVDTWKASSSASSYQLQVRLMRRAGAGS